MNGRQWDTGVEHALTVQEAGGMQMWAGGEGGISDMHGVQGLLAHTHPPDVLNGFNPSPEDMLALERLGQQQSLILWRGGIYQFGPRGLLP